MDDIKNFAIIVAQGAFKLWVVLKTQEKETYLVSWFLGFEILG
jgi:hypothetical protein